jgi:hypothetical protein
MDGENSCTHRIPGIGSRERLEVTDVTGFTIPQINL